jgi:hypothetical protein
MAEAMIAAADTALADIERVEFVTRRFHELRGLSTAAFGASLILAAWMVQAAGVASGFGSGPLQALIFANCAHFVGLSRLDRRYRETFGDVVAPPGSRFLIGLPPLLVLSGAMADMFLQSAGGRRPSVAALAFVSYAVWILLRDWRWRIHYLAAAGAGVAAAIVTAAVPGQADWWGAADPPRAATYLLGYALIGLGMVAAGLFDHHLLALSVRTPPDAPRPPRPAGLRTVAAAFAFVLASGGFLWWGALAMTLPLVLMIPFIAYQIVVAVPDTLRGVREWNRSGRVSLPSVAPLDLNLADLVMLFVIALAAAIEGMTGTRGLFALALAGSLVRLAARDWAERKRYVLAALAAAALAVFSARIDPARAFAFVVFAVSAAVMCEGLLRYRKEKRNADTV